MDETKEEKSKTEHTHKKKIQARHLTCGVCQSNLHINVQRIGHILCYLYMVLCDVEFVRDGVKGRLYL